jgi:cell wall-associated NlpC family hydrolase
MIQPAAAPAGELARSSDNRSPVGRERRRWRRVLGLVVPVAVVGSALMSMPSAVASPKPTLGQVEKKVVKLQNQAEQASEDYDTTRVQLKSVNVRLQASQVKVAAQQQQVAKAKYQIGLIAAQAYKQGQLSTLDLVFSDDPENALTQAGFLPSLGQQQAEAMNLLKLSEQNLLNTQDLIKQQQTKAQAAKNKMQANKKTVDKKLAEVTAQLNKLKASDRTTVLNFGTGAVAGSRDVAGCLSHAAGAPSSEAKAAIQYACDHIGDSYVWAADGPSTFDCSGLTMEAYAAGGVALPHSSRLQATYGSSVSISNLEPGDLIFFFSPISHVAIYLGDGLMVHAPHTGTVVQVSSLIGTPTAAVRL